MNQDRAIEILKLFQQNLENAIEQKSLHFKVNVEEIKEALEFLKPLYIDISVLFENIINKVNDANKSDRSIAINKIIFNSPYFKELNMILDELIILEDNKF